MEDHLRNLYQETKECLEYNGKSENDVKWVGTLSEKTTWERFKEMADFMYDPYDGLSEISEDLYVVGDHWWLERFVHGSADIWKYKETPKEPSSEDLIVKDLFCDFFWHHIYAKNHGVPTGSKYLDSHFEHEIKLKKRILEISTKIERKELENV